MSKPATTASCWVSRRGVKTINPENRNTDYVPISCDTHSEYELAILRRRKLRLLWQEDNVIHDLWILPLDLQTRCGEEFLIGRNQAGETLTLRLDRIRARPTP